MTGFGYGGRDGYGIYTRGYAAGICRGSRTKIRAQCTRADCQRGQVINGERQGSGYYNRVSIIMHSILTYNHHCNGISSGTQVNSARRCTAGYRNTINSYFRRSGVACWSNGYRTHTIRYTGGIGNCSGIESLV